jgi:hypothetical protein
LGAEALGRFEEELAETFPAKLRDGFVELEERTVELLEEYERL